MVERPKVFVQQPIPEQALSRLRQITEVDLFPELNRRPTREEMLEGVAEADYVFALGETPITREIIDASKNLRMIASMEIYPTQIDLDAATEKGIPVTGLPHAEEITETTAEFTIALLMAVAWGVPKAERTLRGGGWSQYQTVASSARRLRGSTLGILGLGKIGSGVARRASAFGMDVAYYDVERKPELERSLGVEWLPLDAMLPKSDFVVICVTLTRETENMVDASFLAMMKVGSTLINTSRGKVVNEPAIADALASGHLASAGLDVFRREIPEPNPGPEDGRLLEMENVVLTPHIGTSASATREWMAGHVVDCIAKDLRGERAYPVLNPEVYGESPRLTERIG